MKQYTEDYIVKFTNWLTDHKQTTKELNTLFIPYKHEDLTKVGHNVGWATTSEMLHYFDYINSL